LSFFGELRRRNVFRVCIAYLAAVWALIQVADVVLPNVGAPTWIIQALIFSSALGFPLALVLAWFYEWTPEGIKAASELEASEPVGFSGRKLDFAIIGLLVVAVGFLVVDDFVLEQATAPERSIAVLPFDNMSAAEENAAFFASGMHDELLTQLSKIGSLKVTSRTSVMEYRDTPKNMREIGQELGVATILEGAVQRAGDMVRINVQLIDAETDGHLWAEIYNRELTAQNIFAIQGEMALSIAAALQATLSPQDLARLNEVPTENTRAYNYYLTGNDYADSDTELAVQQYERAVDEDPEFALAWAALGREHSLMYWRGDDPTLSRLESALEAVERALKLDPDLPEAHLAKGQYYYLGFREYDRALAEYAIAEQGLRGSAELFEAQAMIYRRVGRFGEAIASLDRAIELDPRNTDLLRGQGANYRRLRDYSQVERYLDRVLEITPDNLEDHQQEMALISIWRDGDIALARAIAESPQPARLGRYFWWIFALYDRDYDTALGYLDDRETDVFATNMWYLPRASYLGAMHRLAGRGEQAEQEFQAARVHLEEALDANPDDARLVLALGEAMVGLGEPAEGVRLARRAMDLLPPERDSIVGPRIRLDAIRRVFVPAGDYDAAIEELDTYLAGLGQWSIEGLSRDPRLEPILDDPRFLELVQRYGRQ